MVGEELKANKQLTDWVGGVGVTSDAQAMGIAKGTQLTRTRPAEECDVASNTGPILASPQPCCLVWALSP